MENIGSVMQEWIVALILNDLLDIPPYGIKNLKFTA